MCAFPNMLCVLSFPRVSIKTKLQAKCGRLVLTLYNMTESWPRTSNQSFKDVLAGPLSIRVGCIRIGCVHNVDVVSDTDHRFMIECYNHIA